MEETRTCSKCGGPMTRYERTPGKRVGRRWIYRCKNHQRIRAREIYRAKHPLPVRSTTRFARNSGKQVRKLADWYVRAILSSYTSVPPGAWPNELVEIKRSTLLAKRICLNQATH